MLPVVTGYGAVTTHGSGIGPVWDALTAGLPAGRPGRVGSAAGEFFIAGLPEDYRPHQSVPRNLVHVLDAGSLIAIDAALQALEAAGIGPGGGDSRRFAVVDGLSYRAPGQGTLFAPYGHAVARALGIRGPVLEVGGAEAAGSAAIALGADLISTGRADFVLAGAAQALQPQLVEHLRAQGFAGTAAARPFDESHAGLVPAEGAGYVVLEAKTSAKERGAPVLARVVGTGQIFDPSAEPLSTSDAAEAGRAIQAALGAAGYVQNQVDLVVSCADGRPTVDFADGYGILRTFGRHAYFAAVTTTTSACGQTLAASGPIATALAIEAMARGQAFPIAGFQQPEQDMELTYVRSLEAHTIDCVLITSLGLGGTNVSLVLDRDRD